MMPCDIAHCWSLDNSSALSCLPMPRGSACRNRRHSSHAGLIHKVPLPELCYCSMVNVTRACRHVPFHPLICSWAAAKGCECEWKNCCCLLYCKATHSLVYVGWTAFFTLCLFLPGADVHVPSHPLICVWAAAMGSEYEWNCCWHLNCKATHSLTHSLTHI